MINTLHTVAVYIHTNNFPVVFTIYKDFTEVYHYYNNNYM